MNRLATDMWIKETDLSNDLLDGWWSSHTRRETLKRKGVHLFMLSVPGSRALKRSWDSEGIRSFEHIDELVNKYKLALLFIF